MFTLIFAVKKKVSQEEEVESKRWQIESLVICVPRHFQAVAAFPITGRPTVEARDTTVPSAPSHLPKLFI